MGQKWGQGQDLTLMLPWHNKGVTRFNLRGQAKVNTQWHLFCLVHNVEKLAHSGWR